MQASRRGVGGGGGEADIFRKLRGQLGISSNKANSAEALILSVQEERLKVSSFERIFPSMDEVGDKTTARKPCPSEQKVCGQKTSADEILL